MRGNCMKALSSLQYGVKQKKKTKIDTQKV